MSKKLSGPNGREACPHCGAWLPDESEICCAYAQQFSNNDLWDLWEDPTETGGDDPAGDFDFDPRD